jgi:hypothetical protein
MLTGQVPIPQRLLIEIVSQRHIPIASAFQ